MGTALLKRPRSWAGIALGGTLAAAASFIWTPQLLERDARANASYAGGSPTEVPDRSAGKAEKLSGAAPTNQAPGQPQPAFRFFQDYFDPNYYAYYFYSSPPRSADWARSAQSGVSSPFTLAAIGDISELYKVPSVTLPVLGALSDVSKLVPPAAVTVPAPSSPGGLLTNKTPFHLFVTSESISPSSAESSGSSPLAPASTALPSASSLAGAATGAAGSVTGTVGSMLRR